MSAYLEFSTSAGRKAVPLTGDRIALGAAASNDVVIPDESTVSRLHAVIERFPSGWGIRDLGSRNGTFVNGERVLGERVVHAGDEIRLGVARLTFRIPEPTDPESETDVALPSPQLTRREREILLELCRPVLSGDLFREPANVKEIAGALVVSEAAVKQHLAHLYDKFGVHDGVERRRLRLANEAIRRAAVTIADLRGRST